MTPEPEPLSEDKAEPAVHPALIEAFEAGQRDGYNAALEEAADEIEAMSSAVTPNMGSANGAFVKAGIVDWLRAQVKAEDKP